MDNLSGIKILIVDDEEFNVFILENVLELEQASVVSVEDGEKAIEYLHMKNDVDIILTDIMMPNLDGYGLISQIQASGELKEIPVIAISAKAVDGESEVCKELGAVDYVKKPIEMDKLIEIIKHHLREKERRLCGD